MKEFKKIFTLLFLIIVIFSLTSCAKKSNIYTTVELQVGSLEGYINNKAYKLEFPPFTFKDRTMVPLRFIGEALRANIGWIAEEKQAFCRHKDNFMELWIGRNNARVNGKKVELDIPPLIKNERTFVPIRLIAEGLKVWVSWDPTVQAITITDKPSK